MASYRNVTCLGRNDVSDSATRVIAAGSDFQISICQKLGATGSDFQISICQKLRYPGKLKFESLTLIFQLERGYRLQQTINKMITSKTKITKQQLKDLHEAEKLLTDKEALRLGVVDEIVTKWDDIGG